MGTVRAHKVCKAAPGLGNKLTLQAHPSGPARTVIDGCWTGPARRSFQVR